MQWSYKILGCNNRPVIQFVHIITIHEFSNMLSLHIKRQVVTLNKSVLFLPWSHRDPYTFGWQSSQAKPLNPGYRCNNGPNYNINDHPVKLAETAIAANLACITLSTYGNIVMMLWENSWNSWPLWCKKKLQNTWNLLFCLSFCVLAGFLKSKSCGWICFGKFGEEINLAAGNNWFAESRRGFYI